MRKFLLTALLLLPLSVIAKPHTLSWTWPVADCDAGVVAIADLLASEIIVSTSPMPMPSDTDGPCAATPDPGPPTGADVHIVTIPDTEITLNLQPGVTYYARIRVSAFTDGNWSAWSAELQFTVPYGRPERSKFN